jgi:hypothetical protein
MSNEILKVGDKVMWRGAWGKEIPKEAMVTEMELCGVGQKYGKPISSAKWTTVENDKVVVTLDNGHWAYGNQLSRI